VFVQKVLVDFSVLFSIVDSSQTLHHWCYGWSSISLFFNVIFNDATIYFLHKVNWSHSVFWRYNKTSLNRALSTGSKIKMCFVRHVTACNEQMLNLAQCFQNNSKGHFLFALILIPFTRLFVVNKSDNSLWGNRFIQCLIHNTFIYYTAQLVHTVCIKESQIAVSKSFRHNYLCW